MSPKEFNIPKESFNEKSINKPNKLVIDKLRNEAYGNCIAQNIKTNDRVKMPVPESVQSDKSAVSKTIDLLDKKTHYGSLPKDNNFFRVNLSESKGLVTSKLDNWLAKNHIADNQYNCHYYTNKYIDPNYKPGPLTNLFNSISQSINHECAGSLFASEKTMLNHGFIKVQIAPSLQESNLKPGDIVCVVDNSKPQAQQEVHSAIVIGIDNHNNIILRQKLNEKDPVVDMTARHFDDLELGNNINGTMHVEIYRKQSAH